MLGLLIFVFAVRLALVGAQAVVLIFRACLVGANGADALGLSGSRVRPRKCGHEGADMSVLLRMRAQMAGRYERTGGADTSLGRVLFTSSE